MNETINTSPTKTKSSKKRRMFDFLVHAVDKVFYQVYDGEPVRGRRKTESEIILEEEVLFCKNNVCVHILGIGDNSDNLGMETHLPGYMCIKKIYKADNIVSDLILSWVPNKLLTVNSTEDVDIFSDVLSENVEINESVHSMKIEENEVSPPLPPQDTSELDIPNGGDVFSINLLDMKTVKLFYSQNQKDSGQFVIGSHENEYKVFHFHNTGLLKLTDIFSNWNGCLVDSDLIADEVGQQVFYINTNETSDYEYRNERYPEEGRYKAMNMNIWHGFLNQVGQIEDGFNFRKHVFFGGLSQEVRPDAWKYLMYYYPMHSTHKEREVMKEEKKKSYESIHNKRLSLSGEDYETFWKNVQFTVDKDVVRTDRSHPYYAGQDNPNIQKMRNILLNYATHNPTMGYTQGMSDLVAPVLATLHDEVESFWCFVGLMEASIFATSPTDDSMDRSLNFLRELLRIILPEFYMHCLCNDYDLNLLFAHRWLVLCFKREFIFHEVLKIWEACWARYQTDYFHIFLCVAVVSLYGDICLEKKMDADEILQYFTDMATKFNGSAVLKEARAILFKFRQLNRIPCSLRGLLSGKGVWDGGIAPEVECVSHHQRCCYEFQNIKSSTTNKKEERPTNDVLSENIEIKSPPIINTIDGSIKKIKEPNSVVTLTSQEKVEEETIDIAPILLSEAAVDVSPIPLSEATVNESLIPLSEAAVDESPVPLSEATVDESPIPLSEAAINKSPLPLKELTSSIVTKIGQINLINQLKDNDSGLTIPTDVRETLSGEVLSPHIESKIKTSEIMACNLNND